MKHRALTGLFLSGFIASVGAASNEPSAVSPSLIRVVSEGPVRLLVFEVCSPEHCWHQPYLQWLNLKGASRSIIKSVPIAEFSTGAVVENVESEWRTGTSPRFTLKLAPSHGDTFEPYSVIIEPKAVGKYEVLRP